jgi:hypothetical protein
MVGAGRAQNSPSHFLFFAKCITQKDRLLFWSFYFLFASKTDNPYNNGLRSQIQLKKVNSGVINAQEYKS